jgi:hypothetical protein
MRLTMGQLRQLLREEIMPDCWDGSHPDETYEELLEDDPMYQEKSVLVPDDVKKAIHSYFGKMGLSKPAKKRP